MEVEFLDNNESDDTIDFHEDADVFAEPSRSVGSINDAQITPPNYPPSRKRPTPQKSVTAEIDNKLKMAQLEALQSKKTLNELKTEYYKKKLEKL